MFTELLSPTSPLMQSPVLLALAIILCTFILEDPTTLAVGLLLEKNLVSFPFAFFSLMIGIFLGDLGLYFIGIGIRKGFWKQASQTIKLSSYSLIILARFVPGMRTITFTSAGLSGFPLGPFCLLALPSTIVWTLILIMLGKNVFAFLEHYPSWVSWMVAIVLIFSLWLLEKFIRSRFARRNAVPRP